MSVELMPMWFMMGIVLLFAIAMMIDDHEDDV